MALASLRKASRAFTLIELLVVVAVIAILAALVVQPHNDSRHRARLTHCLSNLRQISLAFGTWAEAKGEVFPWNVSTNTGGTRELIASGNAADHFLLLSKIVPQPSAFYCPSDRFTRLGTDSYAGFSNTNLSYFVSLEASQIKSTQSAKSILAGDRHLSVSNQLLSSGLFVTTNYAALGWKGFHPSRGVLAFVDGHAETIKTDKVQSAFQQQAKGPNRLVIP